MPAYARQTVLLNETVAVLFVALVREQPSFPWKIQQGHVPSILEGATCSEEAVMSASAVSKFPSFSNYCIGRSLVVLSRSFRRRSWVPVLVRSCPKDLADIECAAATLCRCCVVLAVRVPSPQPWCRRHCEADSEQVG